MKSSTARRLFQGALLCSLVICFIPLLPGLAGLIFTAFGYIPAVNQYQFSLAGFVQLAAWPGLTASLLLTVFISLSSTFLSALLAFAILQSCWNKPWWCKLENLLAPVLALPHVAFAVGLAFLFTSSGFIARISNLFINDSYITNWNLINNQYGLGLIFGLTLKEIPFIVFMSLALLKQLNVSTTLKTAQSLGYSSRQAWQKIIFPQWLAKIRFPLFVVLAYSLSVVDVALVIGPTRPATLPILVWQWLNDADLFTLQKASAGAALLLLLCIALIYLLRLSEWLMLQKWRTWQYSGRCSLPLPGLTILLLTYLITLATVPILVLWSFAKRWSFPDILPSSWTLRFWHQEWSYLLEITISSISIALLSATAALVLVFFIHEHNSRTTSTKRLIPHLLIAVPILAPQLSILSGMQVAVHLLPGQSYYLWVIWAHIFFVFPYIYLALDGPWRSYDSRLDKAALSLGLSPLQVWWKIKLPVLMPAVCIAWAVGISVSLAQYLPTLMLGGGRIVTLTTEAVALSSGQDRRISAIYALLQSLVPFFFYITAIIVSRRTGPLDNQIKSTTRNVISCKKPIRY
ncbi:ABC transporter permease [Psychromonas ossibalaenae]|uniref:ABC transporter permease n=1 Tax=Psychromonas ossibalaenae TaxID=444922 RepID=UPI0003A36E7B|nr:ABC transporter permease subunit [Psychromonas ossibalaenae]